MKALTKKKPTDVTVAVAMHYASLECSRRVMIAELPTQVEHLYRRGAVAALHAFVQLVGALDRKRGKDHVPEFLP
jgi:hypothetical protein